METHLLSDEALLTRLIGLKATTKLYRGRLAPLACGAEGYAPHPRLAASVEFVRRLMHEELCRGPVMGSPHVAVDYLRAHFLGKEHEAFVCLFLDTRHRLIQAEELFRGSLDGAEVHPREIVKRVLTLNAAAVILAHNHPSGVAEASAADRAVTVRIKQALALVDVRVLDHIIVGGTTTMSFGERGML